MTRTLVSCPSCRETVGHRRARATGRGPLLRLLPGVGATIAPDAPDEVALVCRCGTIILWRGDVVIRPRDASVLAVV